MAEMGRLGMATGVAPGQGAGPVRSVVRAVRDDARNRRSSGAKFGGHDPRPRASNAAHTPPTSPPPPLRGAAPFFSQDTSISTLSSVASDGGRSQVREALRHLEHALGCSPPNGGCDCGVPPRQSVLRRAQQSCQGVNRPLSL
eukprot:168350-Chlamydomonas_euryale.AAC.1